MVEFFIRHSLDSLPLPFCKRQKKPESSASGRINSGYPCFPVPEALALLSSAGLLHFAAADARHTDFLPDNNSVFLNTDRLYIRFKRPRRNLHHMHPDPAFFLGKTFPDNGRTVKFLLPADIADIAHFLLLLNS